MTLSTDKSGLKLGLKVVAAAVAVILLALFVFDRFLREPAGDANPPLELPGAVATVAPPVPALPVETDGEAVVASVTGRVERSTAGGEWAVVREGETLRANDAIRTAANSRAELEVDNKSSITITPSSEIGIREVRKAAHTFKLVRGQLAVDYQPDGTRTLRIEGDGGHAVAKTDGAKFSVLSSGGTFAVATQTGSVNLEAAGKAVAVNAGEQSVARPGIAPSVAAPIPVKLLLKLATSGKQGCPTVRGVAQPGSEVLVDGRSIATDARGAFVIQGPTDGRASMTVVTRHVSGKVEEKVVACRTRSKVDVSIRWKKQAP